MSLPVREQVLQVFAARLGAVRSLQVFAGKEIPDDGYLTVIVDGEEQDAGSDHDHTRMAMQITAGRMALVAGRKDDGWHAEANETLASLIRDALTPDATLGGLAEHIEYTGGAAGEIQDQARGVAAQAFFTIRYRFVHGNPYLIDEA